MNTYTKLRLLREWILRELPDALASDSADHYNFIRDLSNHAAFHTADCSNNVGRFGCSCELGKRIDAAQSEGK